MSEVISHERLLEVGEKIIKSASSYKKRTDGVIYKSENDGVTDFDIYLQESLFVLLNILDPGVPILSEERVAKLDTVDAWIVDPLDGTSNYIQGLSCTAVAAAKVSGLDVLAALVVDLANGDMYTALKNEGLRINGLPNKVATNAIKLVGVSTGYLKRGGQVPEGCNARLLGSQALHLCMVSRGVFSSCVNYEAKAWDDVAGSLMVSESGGLYKHQYPNMAWVDLCTEGSSLRSCASRDPETFQTFCSSMKEMKNG